MCNMSITTNKIRAAELLLPSQDPKFKEKSKVSIEHPHDA